MEFLFIRIGSDVGLARDQGLRLLRLSVPFELYTQPVAMDSYSTPSLSLHSLCAYVLSLPFSHLLLSALPSRVMRAVSLLLVSSLCSVQDSVGTIELELGESWRLSRPQW